MAIKLQGFVVEDGARNNGGLNSHAEGSNTNASGTQSHAEGISTTASGSRSHAEGSATTASGSLAHAEGGATTASGNSSHAEGSQSVASGNFSHAGGYAGLADGYASWARGNPQSVTNNVTRTQVAVYTMGAQAAGTASTLLTLDGGSSTVTITGAGTNVLVVPALSTYLFELKLVARRLAMTASSQAWSYSGVITRDSTGSARLVGSVTQIGTWADTAIGTVTIAASSANNYLQIYVAGNNASYTTVWNGVMITSELTAAN